VQRGAVCCIVIDICGVMTHKSVLQYIAVCCSVLQCNAACCSVIDVCDAIIHKSCALCSCTCVMPRYKFAASLRHVCGVLMHWFVLLCVAVCRAVM